MAGGCAPRNGARRLARDESRASGSVQSLRRRVYSLSGRLNYRGTSSLAMRVFIEREFRGFADEAVVIQMHADRERVVANFVEGFPCLHGVFEQQIVRFLRDQIRDFM